MNDYTRNKQVLDSVPRAWGGGLKIQTTRGQQAALVAINSVPFSEQYVCPSLGVVTIKGVKFNKKILNCLLGNYLIRLVRGSIAAGTRTHYELTELGMVLAENLPTDTTKGKKIKREVIVPENHFNLTAALRAAGVVKHSSRKLFVLMHNQGLVEKFVCFYNSYGQKNYYSLTLEGKQYGEDLPEHLFYKTNPVFCPEAIPALLARLGLS